MKLKKLLLIAAAAFVAYYVLRSPGSAAGAAKGAVQSALNVAQWMAESLARFLDALFT